MFLKIFFILFVAYNSLNSAQAENEPKYIQASNEFSTLDFTHFGRQLEVMKTGNDLLRLYLENIQFRMDKQEQILERLEKKFDILDKQEEFITKIDNIPQILQILLQNLEEKIIKISQNSQNVESQIVSECNEHYYQLNDLIGEQYKLIQKQIQESTANDKWQMISEIKERVKEHDISLGSLNEKLNNIEYLLSQVTLETQHFTILESIDKQLKDIKSITANQSNQIAFNQDFNKNETTQAIIQSEDQKPLCTVYPTSCDDFNANYCENDKCRIYNRIYGPEPFWVSCDNTVDGGDWTVIQRRINGSVDFYRNWSEYKEGFGDIEGEFFLGLEKLHALTTRLQPMELMILLKDFDDTLKYAKYDEFVIDNEANNYKLIKVGKYSGDSGDSFSYHQGFNFTTKDRDNDIWNNGNCAVDKKGAWWYGNCHWSNLNGKYYNVSRPPKGEKGICWSDFHGFDYSLKFVQMMIRSRKKYSHNP